MLCRDPAAGAGDPTERIESGGLARTYVLHLPAGRAPSQAVPLVFAFHGGGGQGRGMIALTGFDAEADRGGFIVASGQLNATAAIVDFFGRHALR